MSKFILLSLLLSSLASASSDKAVCELVKKHIPHALLKGEYFEVDLDRDNLKELFVTEGTRGNAGTSYKVLLNTENDYVLAGEVFVHPLAVQLMNDQSSSKSFILTYIRNGVESGDLVTYEFSGKAYKKIKSEHIPSSSYDKRIFPLKVNVLEVICK